MILKRRNIWRIFSVDVCCMNFYSHPAFRAWTGGVISLLAYTTYIHSLFILFVHLVNDNGFVLRIFCPSWLAKLVALSIFYFQTNMSHNPCGCSDCSWFAEHLKIQSRNKQDHYCKWFLKWTKCTGNSVDEIEGESVNIGKHSNQLRHRGKLGDLLIYSTNS